jgi:hypothetical protein
VPSGATVLASGSQEFLRATWRANKGNPTFLLTDSHWPHKTISCKIIPWFRLRHLGFGGTTNSVALLGLPNIQLKPRTTTLRRNIGHILEHDIRPNNWSLTKALSCPDPMTPQSRLDTNHLGRDLLYQIHLRALTLDKVGIAFGLPAFQRLGGLTMGSFPLVPLQIMDGILKAYGRENPTRHHFGLPCQVQLYPAQNKVGYLRSSVSCLRTGLIPAWSRPRQPELMMQASSSRCGMLDPHYCSRGQFRF